MDGILFFGSIFRYNEHEYVYLGSSGEITYAAKIIDKRTTDILLDRQEKLSSRARNSSVEDMPVFAFVVLKTPGFENRAAHFGETNVSEDIFNPMGCLIDEDIQSLRKEILESRCVSQELKDIISKS